MKKFIPAIFLLALVLVLGACGNNAANNKNNANNGAAEATATPEATESEAAEQPAAGTVTYQAESGPVEIPANPQRIVALAYAPNLISLGANIVGVDQWTNMSPLFTDKLKGVEVVSDEDLEKIIELDPDLIVVGTESKNVKKLGEIAPTVAFTWGKLDYLNQQVEIGKILGKEQEATTWVDDFKSRAASIGEEVKAKIGADTTVSVLETDSKSFYVFGNNFARGTEIIYQAMGLKMPEKVTKDAQGPGYLTLSQEIIPEYAGDWVVLSRSTANDNAFMNTDVWKNIAAVKNNHVIEIDTEASSYSDPTTLESLLTIFKDGFLK
ncbi:iron-hydroxamate ABC transporter substrate-binding protein [Paenibacillus sp. YAF4_2]|uniref:iron-hydroxamate ABC transporter substrate-binding protein n=1 Tax=Paenibacillus sp. YAF4_2 TaxID=3233085 RepID=UPI003F97C215